jgi:hypothetical protein
MAAKHTWWLVPAERTPAVLHVQAKDIARKHIHQHTACTLAGTPLAVLQVLPSAQASAQAFTQVGIPPC